MHGKSESMQWEWKEGKVDRSAPRLELFYGDWGESALPVALVAKPVGQSFPVAFLQLPELDQGECERIKWAVTKELTFYHVEKGEPDPWQYAIYHCGTRPRRLPTLRALPARHPGGYEGVGCQGRPRPGGD
jgi:hypothetical protein